MELGHNVLVTTDQYHFIVDYEVIKKQADSALALPLVLRLGELFELDQYSLESISFDRGFHCGLAKQALQK